MKFPIPNLLLFFCLLSFTSAFNITEILSNFSDFRTFNDFLSRTTLAEQINQRKNVTLFVVDNNAMTTITKKPMDTVSKIMSLHVALEYYDTKKLEQLPTNEPTLMSTLLQANGQATGQQGFLKVTIDTDSTRGLGVAISSASSSDLKASVIKGVLSQPNSISVIQINKAIVPNIISPPTAAPTNMPSSPWPSGSPEVSHAPKTGNGDDYFAASPNNYDDDNDNDNDKDNDKHNDNDNDDVGDKLSGASSLFSVSYALVFSVVLILWSVMELP